MNTTGVLWFDKDISAINIEDKIWDKVFQINLKWPRPLPPTHFSENMGLGNFPLGFEVPEGLESIGNTCGLQIDGFSRQTEPHASTFNDFHDFVVWYRLRHWWR